MSPIERRHAEELRVLSAEHDAAIRRAEAAEALVAMVESVCAEAELRVSNSFARMFNGEPFPAVIDASHLRSLLHPVKEKS